MSFTDYASALLGRAREKVAALEMANVADYQWALMRLMHENPSVSADTINLANPDFRRHLRQAIKQRLSGARPAMALPGVSPDVQSQLDGFLDRVLRDSASSRDTGVADVIPRAAVYNTLRGEVREMDTLGSPDREALRRYLSRMAGETPSESLLHYRGRKRVDLGDLNSPDNVLRRNYDDVLSLLTEVDGPEVDYRTPRRWELANRTLPYGTERHHLSVGERSVGRAARILPIISDHTESLIRRPDRTDAQVLAELEAAKLRASAPAAPEERARPATRPAEQPRVEAKPEKSKPKDKPKSEPRRAAGPAVATTATTGPPPGSAARAAAESAATAAPEIAAASSAVPDAPKLRASARGGLGLVPLMAGVAGIGLGGAYLMNRDKKR